MATIKVRKTGFRQFTAGIQLKGQWILGTGPQVRSAVKALRSKLEEIGADRPDFEVAILATKPESKPAEKPEQPAPKPEETKAPAWEPETMGIDSSDLDDETEAVPAAGPDGWITPISDLAAWKAEVARALNTSIAIGIPRSRDAKLEFRKNVSLLMETHGYIGAYRVLPSGLSFLATYAKDIIDPTVRQARPGDGARQMKDINGNWVDSKGESLQLKDRPVQKERRYWYPGGKFAYVKADSQGNAWRESAARRGMTAEQSELMYKLGFVVSLRAAGKVPHTPFEKDLATAGYTEERISSVVEEVKSRAAKAA